MGVNVFEPEDDGGRRQRGWEERHVDIQSRASWNASGEPGSQPSDSLGAPEATTTFKMLARVISSSPSRLWANLCPRSVSDPYTILEPSRSNMSSGRPKSINSPRRYPNKGHPSSRAGNASEMLSAR